MRRTDAGESRSGDSHRSDVRVEFGERPEVLVVVMADEVLAKERTRDALDATTRRASIFQLGQQPLDEVQEIAPALTVAVARRARELQRLSDEGDDVGMIEQLRRSRIPEGDRVLLREPTLHTITQRDEFRAWRAQRVEDHPALRRVRDEPIADLRLIVDLHGFSVACRMRSTSI